MKAAIEAVEVALRVAESNARVVVEPYKGHNEELAQSIIELREGLALLTERTTTP